MTDAALLEFAILEYAVLVVFIVAWRWMHKP